MNTGWLLLIVPGLIWGTSFLFIAEGLNAVAPNGITFLRIAIGFTTLACFPAARTPVARKDWGKVAWLGLTWFAFPLSMFPFAEQRVSSALTGMLNGANPLFTAVVASVIAKTGTFPLDLVRKRIQVQGPTRSQYIHRNIPEYTGTVGALRTIVAHEGLRGLYRGLTVSLFKAAPASAVTIWTYERALKFYIRLGEGEKQAL